MPALSKALLSGIKQTQKRIKQFTQQPHEPSKKNNMVLWKIVAGFFAFIILMSLFVQVIFVTLLPVAATVDRVHDWLPFWGGQKVERVLVPEDENMAEFTQNIDTQMDECIKSVGGQMDPVLLQASKEIPVGTSKDTAEKWLTYSAATISTRSARQYHDPGMINQGSGEAPIIDAEELTSRENLIMNFYEFEQWLRANDPDGLYTPQQIAQAFDANEFSDVFKKQISVMIFTLADTGVLDNSETVAEETIIDVIDVCEIDL